MAGLAVSSRMPLARTGQKQSFAHGITSHYRRLVQTKVNSPHFTYQCLWRLVYFQTKSLRYKFGKNDFPNNELSLMYF